MTRRIQISIPVNILRFTFTIANSENRSFCKVEKAVGSHSNFFFPKHNESVKCVKPLCRIIRKFSLPVQNSETLPIILLIRLIRWNMILMIPSCNYKLVLLGLGCNGKVSTYYCLTFGFYTTTTPWTTFLYSLTVQGNPNEFSRVFSSEKINIAFEIITLLFLSTLSQRIMGWVQYRPQLYFLFWLISKKVHINILHTCCNNAFYIITFCGVLWKIGYHQVVISTSLEWITLSHILPITLYLNYSFHHFFCCYF